RRHAAPHLLLTPPLGRPAQGRPSPPPRKETPAMTAVLSNPAAIDARAARLAERIARQQRIAEQRAAEAAEAAVSDEQPPADHWDTPVPYALTGAAEDVLTPAADGDTRAPARTVALSPVALHALAAAVKGATAHPNAYTPVLEVARVTLADGALSIVATDRFRVHRLTVPAEGAAHAEGFIRPADLTAVARALAPAAARRGEAGTAAPVTVSMDRDERRAVRPTMGAGHTTTWEDMSDYPPVDRFFDVDTDRDPVAEWHANPRYMGAAMTAAAVVADANAPVRV